MIECTEAEQIERLNARVVELLTERDRLRVRLASARKALEEIETFCNANDSTLGALARLSHVRGTARQQLLLLTDEKGKS